MLEKPLNIHCNPQFLVVDAPLLLLLAVPHVVLPLVVVLLLGSVCVGPGSLPVAEVVLGSVLDAAVGIAHAIANAHIKSNTNTNVNSNTNANTNTRG